MIGVGVDILTPDEVEALTAAISPRTATGIRNRALIALLYGGGLRLHEALDLHPGDVDAARGRVVVRGRSATSRRVLTLGPAPRRALEAWAAARAEFGFGPAAPFVCTLQGERVKDAYVRALFPRLAARAGVGKRVHALGLRASHAVALDRELSLEALREHLGMESVAETQQYLERHRPRGPRRPPLRHQRIA